MPRKDDRIRSRGGASKRQEISVFARPKGLPKAAKQASDVAKRLGARKAGKTKLLNADGVRAGTKYARGIKGPSDSFGKSAHGRTPRFGDKGDKAAKAKFEATKAKMAGKKAPSLGIRNRPSTTGTGHQRTTSYNGMRPGPLKD